MELYKRAFAQKLISVDDAKRFNDTELKDMIVSNSINGAEPKSLFDVNESVIERVRLQGNTISHDDFNKIKPEQKQELISKGIFPSNDIPTMLTNMPFVTRSYFERMTPDERQKVISDKIEVKEPKEMKELDIHNLISVLKRNQEVLDGGGIVIVNEDVTD